MNISYSSQIEFLHYCSIGDHCLSHVIRLYEQNSEIIKSKNTYNDNALILSVKEKNNDIVKYMVENTSIDLNHQNEQGCALFHSILYHNLDAFKILVDHSQLLMRNKKKQNMIFMICKVGQESFLEYLMEKIQSNQKNDILNELINSIDDLEENCLFEWARQYTFHKNDYLFDLILNEMRHDTLYHKNQLGMNLLEKLHEMNDKINMRPMINLIIHHGNHI